MRDGGEDDEEDKCTIYTYYNRYFFEDYFGHVITPLYHKVCHICRVIHCVHTHTYTLLVEQRYNRLLPS